MNAIVRDSRFCRIEGEEVRFEAGTAFRFDPETKRRPAAGPEGFAMAAVGPSGGSYEPRGAF